MLKAEVHTLHGKAAIEREIIMRRVDSLEAGQKTILSRVDSLEEHIMKVEKTLGSMAANIAQIANNKQ